MSGHTIPLSSPDITDLEREAVLQVLAGTQLSLGPRMPEFEQALCNLTGARYAVAVNSGTSALHLCVKGLGIGAGDDVITSPFSFVASANCLLFEGARPVFADIDPITWNIDAARIEPAIGPNTRAILPIHVFGRPADMASIVPIARRRRLAIVEDSCEAIGASVNGRAAGMLGDAGVFAFYPNKQITTGEGGAIVTNNEKIASLARSWRNQGRGDGGAWLQHERLGFNYRLSDINCALGIAQLSRLPEICAARTAVAERYSEMLADCEGVIVPAPAAAGVEISWFVYVVRLTDDFSREDRDGVLSILRKAGIGCSNYFTPIHLQPFYREQFGYAEGDFPVTEHIAERTIALPFFNRLPAGDAVIVVRELQRAITAVRIAAKRSKVMTA